MSKNLLQRLDDEFSKSPSLVCGPVSAAAVEKIQSYAGFRLPESYRIFVEAYGGAIVGPYSIYGSGASEAMGEYESSVIDMTERFRADNWPGTEGALVISMDHAGNAITLTDTGTIERFDHDYGIMEQRASDFEGFIVDWCLNR